MQRLRFSYPQVRAVIMTSELDRMFCAGANIGMLAQSEHAFKVNFCKFCNETLAAIEDASASGQVYIAALNGTAAGGGYELALACEQILLADDGSSTVALPEVPLLGVLPGTGGLTRLTDKRGVRRDLADVFATTAEGVRGQRAVDWRLVDEIARPTDFRAAARRLAEHVMTQVPAPPGRPTGRPATRASSSPRWFVPHRTTACGTSMCSSISTGAPGRPRSPSAGRPRRRPTWPRCTTPGPRPGRWPPPASSTTRSAGCGSTSPSSAPGC